MRQDNTARTSEIDSAPKTERFPLTYTNPKGEKTDYELQEIRYNDGRRPAYIISEAEGNQGPGFENGRVSNGVAHQAAEAIVSRNDPKVFPDSEQAIRPRDITLYQQQPDGNFYQMGFREIGRNGGSNVDMEMEQNHLDRYQQMVQNREPTPVQAIEFTQSKQSLYSREEVEDRVNAPLSAPKETPQQQYEQMMNEQWRDLSGPSGFDRAAEKAARPPEEAKDYETAERQQEQAPESKHAAEPQQEAEASQTAEAQQSQQANQAADTHQAAEPTVEPERAQADVSAQTAAVHQQAAAQQQASAEAQRSSEQVQQMNEHVQQQTR